MKIFKMSLTELFLAKQYLVNYAYNPTNIGPEHAKNALDILRKVDKEIWGRIVSSDTPWGKYSLNFTDDNFDETLKKLKNGTLDGD